MSKLYTTMSVDDGRSVVSRRAHRNIKSSLQSYDGSVIVTMFYNDRNELQVCINLGTGSTLISNQELYSGSFDNLRDVIINGKILT